MEVHDIPCICFFFVQLNPSAMSSVKEKKGMHLTVEKESKGQFYEQVSLCRKM